MSKEVLIPFCAVHVVVVLPIWYIVPDTLSHVTDIELPSCVAVTEKVPTRPAVVGASNIRSPGLVI